ncbi:hypothetical protein WR25_20921 [Diploscapter pachys]|uniref:Zinc metalloproteinase n=1 Tax=Diploscapter pachys TaxID=2018661 RepID=A0A2A2KAI6_9BILA|nr:hypothetical protein WR25_20921 [Diploscapter pachys]
MNYSSIVFILLCIQIIEVLGIDDPVLSDFVDPKEQYALRDQLAQNVELEYKNEEYIAHNPAADTPVMPDNNQSTISKLNEKYLDHLFQGDIRITAGLLREIVRESATRKARPKTKNAIITAMRYWQSQTCVKFRPRRNEKVYLYYIDYDAGCWSTVGRDPPQGKQLLSIGRGCEPFGVTSHEIGHALGLFQFTVTGGPSLIAKNPREQAAMGQMAGPSFLDVQKINSHYSCGRACKNKIRCFNGGYQDPKKCGVCRCPPAFGGPRCQQVQQSNPPNCRGVLNAKPSFRRLRINVKPRNTKQARQCNYHIRAPAGKKIEIYVEGAIGKCIQGCYHDSVEIKAQADKRVTGYRFCCGLNKPQRFVSDNNLVPIISRAGRGQAFVQLIYRYVNPHRSHHDPEDTSHKEAMDGEEIAVEDEFSTISPEVQKAMVSNSTELEESHKLAFERRPASFNYHFESIKA